MADNKKLGGKVRRLRRREGITQKQLAQKLDISASYLNLIEANKRPLPAGLLIKLAQLFQVDLASFAEDDEGRLEADLLEVLADPVFEGAGFVQADVRDFVAQSPELARAMGALYRAYQRAGDRATGASAPVRAVDPMVEATEEVSDLIAHHNNYFPELEDAADTFRRNARLDGFERFSAMSRYLESDHGVRVSVVPYTGPTSAMRRFDPEQRHLILSELLPPQSRHFQVAHQVGLVECSALLDRIVADERLTSRSARKLARVAMANYFAGAVLMPYGPFLEAARAYRYDIELLGHRFRTSFEQVCHRLTTLRRPGSDGIPFHMLRIDVAGNISKRFSGSGIRIARYSGACPRWNVHHAFLTPEVVRRQVSRMPDGSVYFCVARTVHKDSGGFLAPKALHAIGLGCERSHASGLVYADGIDMSDAATAVPVGTTCRLCPRTDCQQRAFPATERPLRVDENVRGVNFYSEVGEG